MNREPLSKYVKTPEVSSLELNLQWPEVRRRMRRHRQVRVGVAVALVATFLFGGLIVSGFEFRPTERLAAGGTVGAELEPRRLELADGSEIVVAPGGAVSLSKAEESEVVIILERGRAAFDVTKKPNRRFVVKAETIDVRVVGTQFIVQREGRQVEVEVLRGVVEVRDGEVVTRLERGHHWTRAAQSIPSVERSVEEPNDSNREDVVVPSERAPKYPKPTHRDGAIRGATGGGLDSVKPKSVDLKDPSPGTPSDVFAAAMSARSAGRIREAILGFQQVCERWPTSAFAPMSAFEWGRLALENENDPRQAARAFERTLEVATSESLLEDAVARLAEAYGRFDREACRRTRAEYVRRFPDGPHLRGVTKACPP